MKFKKVFFRITTTVLTCAFAGLFLMPGQAIAATSGATAAASTTQIKGSEVLVIGDSFLALSHEITNRLEQNARNAGILGANDHFRDNSVSGTLLSGGSSPNIPQQYQNGVNAGTVKYVIMDGGGNDCMMGSVSSAFAAAKTLFQTMQKNGLLKVFYLFYPDAQGGLAGTLNPNLNNLRPQIQSLVTGSTSPKGYFLDLRPTFSGKYSQYILSDGIHPTQAGSYAAADAIWAEMKRVNFFPTDTEIYGDINNDKSVDALDYAGLKQYLMDPKHAYNKIVDLNVDNSVDALDFAILKQYLLKIITTLPVK
ncbi:MAG TPA: dockerin type I domain-containing protein [Clostridia bacterium]|nr:dockerin type I domain-containing protein [Clostridia bacterium]